MKIRLIVFVASLLALVQTATQAQIFFGSDDFNAAGPNFNNALWNVNNIGNLTQTNGRAQLVNINGAFNVDGRITWPASLDNSSHGFDWTATVSATLDYNGTDGVPTLGLFAKPQEGAFFGIMLRGGQPAGTTDIFSSHGASSNVNFAHIGGSFGTVAAATFTTSSVSDVLLRLSWNSSAGTLTSSFSSNGGASFVSLASINASSTFGFSPANGFTLQLYAASGGVEHAANTMFFDNFSVAATSAVPEPSTYAALAGLGALGLAWWRRKTNPAPSA